jgi:glycosyltransferase involved in cell wall biosynthesis
LSSSTPEADCERFFIDVLISVIIPTHNPHPGRLARTLEGLAVQSLAKEAWELVLVDNRSSQFPAQDKLKGHFPLDLRVVREEELGLSQARRRGVLEARGEVLVFVDDDNVLCPDYLAQVQDIFQRNPAIGLCGGASRPEFEAEAPPWLQEFHGLLALRDLGTDTLISEGLIEGRLREYPDFAPIGAGMAIRREALKSWLAQAGSSKLSDRKGNELSSSGDNDIVLHALEAGWRAAYMPELSLTHLIPTGRMQAEYMARLNRGIQKSWIMVLHVHALNPWPGLSRWGCRLRKVKAWFKHKPWTSVSARIRYAGTCGHFEGRHALESLPISHARTP